MTGCSPMVAVLRLQYACVSQTLLELFQISLVLLSFRGCEQRRILLEVQRTRYEIEHDVTSSRTCAIPSAHLLYSTARIRRGIRANCFCSCELHCSGVEWILLLFVSIFQPSVCDFPGAYLQGS